MVNDVTLNKNGYIINKNILNEKELAKIMNDLTVAPLETLYTQQNTDLSFTLYEEFENHIIIPRYYGTHHVKNIPFIHYNDENNNNNNDNTIKNILYDNTQINRDIDEIDIDKFIAEMNGGAGLESIFGQVKFRYTKTLRGDQAATIRIIIEQILKKGGGIANIHTGYGKTTLAIFIAAVLGLKTLIVVPKTFLMNQWEDRIKAFSDATVGILRQKRIDIEDKDIVIGMLQSIAMIDYDINIFNSFDLLIVDECHRTGSKIFSQMFSKINTKYTLGLSATPNRKDGLVKVFEYYLGNEIIRKERAMTNPQMVKIKQLYHYTSETDYKELKGWVNGAIRPNHVKMLGMIIKSNARNKLIIKVIKQLIDEPNRKVLILSSRLEHLTLLKKEIDQYIIELIKEGFCEDDEIKTGYYKGGMKQSQLDMSAEADVIFGTYQMAKEGLDIDGLNALILATPENDIVQAIGRILRKPIEEGDISPLIIDICDTLNYYDCWNNKRKVYYRLQKYNILPTYTYNGNFMDAGKFMDFMKIKYNKELDLRDEFISNFKSQSTLSSEKDVNYFNYPTDIFLINENNWIDYIIKN